MPESEHSEIRKLPLFRDMSDENFEILMRGSYVQTFPPLVEIVSEGEPSDFLHIVLSGSVSLYATWNERETSMTTVRPVSTFIIAASIKDAPYLMSAETLEKSRIVLVPSQDVRTVFEQDPQFARAVVTELAENYRLLVKTTKNLKLRASLERLANYILRQQKRAGGANEFDLSIRKRRLASFLGMTPESLSRAFKNLRDHGVSSKGGRVTIFDQQALEEFAHPNPLIDD
ncbi:transcriptional regulator [Ruegeria marisrubri]|uniref:Transcriptional regulator n=1 Tax=Ruegeria marisrubri TaxID=1685379 RepID=A0A0X3UC73_9RHOB|nr:helix-turn-helix domain-containing protein [Ruegeria marisrubri]KUJ85459.1 transcriptional regulator [Ruegeria marisrubri]